jgi:hypothetical protein
MIYAQTDRTYDANLCMAAMETFSYTHSSRRFPIVSLDIT